MASGGARNRSGPQPDPHSGRSDARGLSFNELPSDGYQGPIPEWPLPRRLVHFETFDDGRKSRVYDDGETERVAERERALWDWAWRTPQAFAWARPSEMWRLHTVAMWVRTFAICESSDATAADKSSLHRFADQIGLTPAGLRESGWVIKAAPVAQPESTSSADAPTPIRRRMRA